jgi:peptide/nickel transport system substrate-binding protein
MKGKQLTVLLVLILALGTLLLSGCSTAAPDVETIIITRIVELEGERVVQEVVVTATPDPAAEAAPPDARDKVPSILLIAPSATYDPARWEATLLMTAAWRELGFDVTLRGFPDFSTLNSNLNSEPFDWHAGVAGFVGRPSRLDPDELLYRPFHCSGIGHGAPNLGAYCNPEYDAVVEAQRTTLNQEERRELVYRAQEIMAEDIPTITQFHRREVFAYNQSRFDNWTPVVGRGLWNIWNLTNATPLTSDRTLRVGWATDIATTNPLSLDAAIETLQWTYDTLAKVGADGAPAPWAAESWSVVDDVTVDVFLRPGMTFHDGQPVTADDVRFSFEFIAEHGTAGFFPAALSPIREVEVVDDLSLRFHLTEPFAPLYFTTFTQIYILPRHIWEDVVEREGVESPDRWNNPEPVGSGPFMLRYHRRGEEILLEANKDHFDAPQADRVLIIHHANTDAVFASLMDGSVDMPDRSISPLNIRDAEAAAHLGLVDVRDMGVFYMVFNLRKPPFNDPAVRQAIAHTLDHDTVVEAVLGGYGEPGQGMIAPANEYWHNPAWATWLEESYNFSTGTARRILQEAGYRWDAAGKLHYPAGGPPVPEQ